ncbi:hypothetical protein HDZ31DRAFT_60516 [Schizophyllum fasciatum]
MSRLSYSATTPAIFGIPISAKPNLGLHRDLARDGKPAMPPVLLKSATDRPMSNVTNGPRLTTFIDCSLSLSDLSAYITAKTLSPIVSPKPFKPDASPYEMLDTLTQTSPLDALGKSLSPRTHKIANLTAPELAITSPSEGLRPACSELADLSWVGTPVLLDYSLLQRDDFGEVTMDSINDFVTPKTHLDSATSLANLANKNGGTNATAAPNFDDGSQDWKVRLSDILSPPVPDVMSPLAARVLMSPPSNDDLSSSCVLVSPPSIGVFVSPTPIEGENAGETGRHPNILLAQSETSASFEFVVSGSSAPSFDMNMLPSTTPAKRLTGKAPPTPGNITLDDAHFGLSELSLERWKARDSAQRTARGGSSHSLAHVIHVQAPIRLRVVGHGVDDMLTAPGQLAAAIAAPWVVLDTGADALNMDDAADAENYLRAAVDLREYQTALDETLRARRELKRVSKMARWWKRRAVEKGAKGPQKGGSDASRVGEAAAQVGNDFMEVESVALQVEGAALQAGKASSLVADVSLLDGHIPAPDGEVLMQVGGGHDELAVEGETCQASSNECHLSDTASLEEGQTPPKVEKRSSLFGLLQSAHATKKARPGMLSNRSSSAPAGPPAPPSRLPTLAGKRVRSGPGPARRGSASSACCDSPSSSRRDSSSSASRTEPMTPVRAASAPGYGIQKPAAAFKSPDSIMAFISV